MRQTAAPGKLAPEAKQWRVEDSTCQHMAACGSQRLITCAQASSAVQGSTMQPAAAHLCGRKGSAAAGRWAWPARGCQSRSQTQPACKRRRVGRTRVQEHRRRQSDQFGGTVSPRSGQHTQRLKASPKSRSTRQKAGTHSWSSALQEIWSMLGAGGGRRRLLASLMASGSGSTANVTSCSQACGRLRHRRGRRHTCRWSRWCVGQLSLLALPPCQPTKNRQNRSKQC